jgi:hypothetical protein
MFRQLCLPRLNADDLLATFVGDGDVDLSTVPFGSRNFSCFADGNQSDVVVGYWNR